MNVNRRSLSGTGLCVCLQLRRASRAVTQLYDAALQPSGLLSTQFALLAAVAKKEPITISELGDLLVIDSTTLRRSLGKLQRMGYLDVVLRSYKNHHRNPRRRFTDRRQRRYRAGQFHFGNSSRQNMQKLSKFFLTAIQEICIISSA